MDTAVSTALALHKQARLDEAGEAYQKILDADPDNADVLNYFGMLEFQRGNSDRGIALAEACIAIHPDHPSGCNNLANMYLSTYRLDDTERYYLKSIALDGGATEPVYNMAVIEKARKNYSKAEGYFNTVLELDPEHVVCLSSLADMYASLGHFNPALQLLKSCLSMELSKDQQKSTLLSMARYCALLDNPEAAIETYNHWLTLYPGDTTATHMLAAMTGLDVPDKADEAYVKGVFDRFSSSFDKVLNNLEYKAPAHIQEVMEERFEQTAPNSLRIVDAGCGTGLCGHFLKPLSSPLIGVDLSPGMLKRAEFRQEYDVLIEEDLTRYFKSNPDTCDLIVSADTLCYFGDLVEFLLASNSALSSQGTLIFTVERYDDETDTGYHLEAHGRYSHTVDYLTKSLLDSGFKIDAIHERELRMERRVPVSGYLVVGKKGP